MDTYYYYYLLFKIKMEQFHSVDFTVKKTLCNTNRFILNFLSFISLWYTESYATNVEFIWRGLYLLKIFNSKILTVETIYKDVNKNYKN